MMKLVSIECNSNNEHRGLKHSIFLISTINFSPPLCRHQQAQTAIDLLFYFSWYVVALIIVLSLYCAYSFFFF